MSFRKIVITNFRSHMVSYLPTYELLLAQALTESGTVEEVKVFTLMKERDDWRKYLDIWKDADLFIFWEHFSTKAPAYVDAYFEFAPLLKEELKKEIYFGGFWATSYGRLFEEFNVFDGIFEGYSIDKTVAVLNVGSGLGERYINVKGDTNFGKYRLDLSHLATPEKYYSKKYRRIAGYITSFGCPRNCKFCYANAVRYAGSGFSARSAEMVKQDIDELDGFYNFETILIKDLNFFYDKQRAYAILDYLKKKNKKPSVNLAVTIDDIGEENIKRIREYEIVDDLYFGLESFSSENRRKVGKPFTDQAMIDAFELAEKHKIHLTGNIILGFPWQSIENIREEIDAGIRYMDTYKYVYINYNAFKPEYGTAIQLKYFPDIFNNMSFRDLVEIYLNDVNKHQESMYAEQFKQIDIEYIYYITRLIFQCKYYENTLSGFRRKMFRYLRKLARKIIVTELSPGPVTRLLLGRRGAMFLLFRIFPLISQMKKQ